MPLTVLSRRSVVYRESGSGEVTVLLVPGREQVQVIKDLAGLGKTAVPAREGATSANAVQSKQAPLTRVFVGRRFIYGTLPTEISDLRQPVRVWLAEDFVPAQCQAFFFIFSTEVVVHGVREQDDEGQLNWRTAQLSLSEGDPIKSIIDAISDYALANSTETLTIAVQKLDLYEKMQAGLATYSISPIPFSKLKPQPGLKPLYRHRDFTILYLTMALFGLITVMASGGYMLMALLERNRLDEEAASIRRNINSIKLNQNVGQIANPQELLQRMNRGINQQPSAIIHAAAEAAAELGSLENLQVVFEGSNFAGLALDAIEAGQLGAVAQITEMKDELLLDQEQTASDSVALKPWIRSFVRGGSVGLQGQVGMVLQIDQPPGTEPPVTEPPVAEPPVTEAPPAPVAVTEPVPAAAPISADGATVSGTAEVSSTAPLPEGDQPEAPTPNEEAPQ